MEIQHPSGCECPAPEYLGRGEIVLSVVTCPICLAWERGRRSAGCLEQVELFVEEGVVTSSEGDEPDGMVCPDSSETLAEIRSVDPWF